MKSYFYLILILILSSVVYAEEFNLEKNKPITHKGVYLNLISVGDSGTIRLRIEDQERLIGKYKELALYDLKIKNLDSDNIFQTAKIDIILTAECLVDEDCNNIKPKPCSFGICEYRNCEFFETKGCAFKNECKSIGSFEDISNVLSYCSEAEIWKSRKAYKEPCENNYECLSNLCNGVCSTSVLGGGKMAPAWILIVIGALLLAEGSFVLLKTKSTKKLIRDLSFLSEKTLKIIATIEILIAAALILWALI